MSRPHPPKPVIAVAVLALLGLLVWWAWRSFGAGDDAATLTGAVETTDYTVAAMGAGTVTEVTVQIGDSVTKGKVLVRLDPGVAQAQVAQAKAGVAAARAGIAAADTVADREVARARLAQAKAGVRLAKIQRGYSVIRAPHDGVVTALLTSAGQVAAPGRSLLTITDPGSAFVRVYVPEPDLASVAVGQRARVIPDGSTTSYDGKVVSVATTAEFTPNNIDTKDQRATLVYQVRVDLTGDVTNLKAGQPVDVVWK